MWGYCQLKDGEHRVEAPRFSVVKNICRVYLGFSPGSEWSNVSPADRAITRPGDRGIRCCFSDNRQLTTDNCFLSS
jgi:hypothetical protein